MAKIRNFPKAGAKMEAFARIKKAPRLSRECARQQAGASRARMACVLYDGGWRVVPLQDALLVERVGLAVDYNISF